MPFPDELVRGLRVVNYDPAWVRDFTTLASRLSTALGRIALAIDHIGSTSVPGLAAKDCIDTQIRVATLDDVTIVGAMSRLGFRLRQEPWNRIEVSDGREVPKLVFAPPVGERCCNVHVRVEGSVTARRNLLFRDYLRADTRAREAWGDFKVRLADLAGDIFEYGQAKAGPTEILMMAAEAWATRVEWRYPSA